MAKAWLGLALPDIEGRAHKILDASRQRFDQQLAELRAFAPTPRSLRPMSSLASKRPC